MVQTLKCEMFSLNSNLAHHLTIIKFVLCHFGLYFAGSLQLCAIVQLGSRLEHVYQKPGVTYYINFKNRRCPKSQEVQSAAVWNVRM
jgi:hypothetical protein